eukprot:CAMPEP_0171411470 /NCGR_PEP_ID=MMETSP0880-20121228/30157_1 /TAXON_ID=67004 /ORGANISM="Thalassiosira weissflogii, Strain CCMP1336" /LENGTH=1269 /DNA_ID=CAMNT_0011928559 /DNA_START=137 /DNA_END=3946 /DNA_ORIENTATION=+
MAAKYTRNPQEPPTEASSHESMGKKRRLPLCIYDIFFDIPHPSVVASAVEATRNVVGMNTDRQDIRARIIDAPVIVCPLVVEELYNPDNITRKSRFAFPEFDENQSNGIDPANRNRALISSHGRTFGANLTKHDIYLVDFISHHHTFSMLLSDGKTRVHCHVRRYLPQHRDSLSRTDVGRRGPRAMVLVTRATGGERFYASVLKTLEAIVIESNVSKSGCFGRKKAPARAFLHSLFNCHAKLTTQYAELRRNGLSLNFTQISNAVNLDGEAAAENAKKIMQQNENLFKITLDKVEFGSTGKSKKHDIKNINNIQIENDTVKFYLPFTLQPGFECMARTSIPEDIHSPIIPLLRYIGPSHLVRLISALLCERRIIIVSKSITRLSTCVRAASSILAQGLLLWRHIEIPVVPKHMIKHLSVKAPYLVGVLEQHASKLKRIEGITDVLCVNVDTNELKTLNMENPRIMVPDMLKKISKKSENQVTAAEMLANDLDEIFQADQNLWQHDETLGKGDKDKPREIGSKGFDANVSVVADDVALPNVVQRRSSLMGMVRRKPTIKKEVSSAAKKIMSLEEKREYATSVDAAAAFGEMIRANFRRKFDDPTIRTDADDTVEIDAPKYSAPSAEILGDMGSVEACTVAENEGGEEDARAALACFFIHMFGDMGMYLSETLGTFWLDRRKFLLRKKQLGEKENSPMFIVLRKFSSSVMFEAFVKGRIEDMKMTARERSSIMPHHIPLFDICCKYLSVNRLEFTITNIRRIVAKTVVSCTRHIAVGKSIAVRARALDLTADTPFNGDIAEALSDLVESCRECNTNLSVVFSVIWHRIGQTKGSMWRHQLLALHLLKNLLLHGPITAITECLDGAEKIYELKSYSNSKEESNKEVRLAAAQCYELLTDLPRLYLRRRRVAFAKVQSIVEVPKDSKSFADYLVGRLPFTSNAQHLHSLFRPEGCGDGADYFDSSLFRSTSTNFNSLTASVRALERLNCSVRDLAGGPRLMYDDETEYYDDNDDVPQDITDHLGEEYCDDNEVRGQEEYYDDERDISQHDDSVLDDEKLRDEEYYDDREDYYEDDQGQLDGYYGDDQVHIKEEYYYEEYHHGGSLEADNQDNFFPDGSPKIRGNGSMQVDERSNYIQGDPNVGYPWRHSYHEKPIDEFNDDDFLTAFEATYQNTEVNDNILESFNNAASSHSGSYFSSSLSGSYFSGSGEGNTMQMMPGKQRSSRKMSDRLHGYSATEDVARNHVILEDDDESGSRSNFSSFREKDPHYDGIV